MEDDSTYMYKTRCDACNSSDANAVYSNGNTHCFSCGNTVRGSKDTFEQSGQTMKKKEFNPSFIEYPNGIRGISKATLEKFTYGVTNGKHVTYYYNTEGDIVAEKYRTKDKEFAWAGSAKEATLFGQNVFPPSDKIKLIITEGEIDCLSVSEIQGNKYPVVSLPNGAASARRDVKENHKYLSSFKELIIMLDQDEVGKKAAIEIQSMFKTGYAKIAKLPMKDASEMLQAGRGKELVSAIFQAEANVPEEILTGTKLTELIDKMDNAESFAYPSFLPDYNHKMGGLHLGELNTITSSTGAGKSTFMRQLQLHFLETTDMNSAVIMLEEDVRTTVEGLVSVKLGQQLHLDDTSKDQDIVRKTWKDITEAKDVDGNYRLNVIDTFGSMDTTRLYDMIHYMATVNGCKIIYIDHLSMLVSGMDLNMDERRTVDGIMTKLKSLTQELNIAIYLISHLNNNTASHKSFEEGAIANINNLRSSGGIKQLSNSVTLLTRNQLAETIEERNTTRVTVLKNRRSGNTGNSDRIRYSSESGIFTLVDGHDETFEDKDLSF